MGTLTFEDPDVVRALIGRLHGEVEPIVMGQAVGLQRSDESGRASSWISHAA